MKNIKYILFLLLTLMTCNLLQAQQVTDLRLNEILIKNETNYIDEYGRHVPWIEVFNSSYNTVTISGCYLTDDTTGLSAGKGSDKWYRIPADAKNSIPQRSFLVFYLDNSPLYGTYHTNFSTKSSHTNYVALISSNAKTLIDIIHYPASLRDTSIAYGCINDGISQIEDKGVVSSNMDFLEYFTPGSTNDVILDVTKSEKLMRDDKYGIGLTVISMSVVFGALILIFIMLKIFGYASRRTAKKNSTPSTATVAEVVKNDNDTSITGETVAAIALALQMHFDSYHDEESEVITIETPSAHYSPWAQKHLSIRRLEKKKR